MTVFKLKEQLFDIIDGLKKRIRAWKYKLSPVRKVKIPKPGSGTRILGVFTAVDPMIQQAVVQVLVYMYEPTFYDLGFDFRPGRSAHDVVIH